VFAIVVLVGLLSAIKDMSNRQLSQDIETPSYFLDLDWDVDVRNIDDVPLEEIHFIDINPELRTIIVVTRNKVHECSFEDFVNLLEK